MEKLMVAKVISENLSGFLDLRLFQKIAVGGGCCSDILGP